MTGPTHLATGVLTAVALSAEPKGIVVAGIASLLPDIDEPNSMIGRRLPLVSLLTSIGGHRKITHSLIGLLLFSGFLFGFFRPYALVGSIAYLLHLILDSLTPMGVPFLFPFGKNYGLRLFRTGGFVEGVYIILLFGIVVLFAPKLFSTF